MIDATDIKVCMASVTGLGNWLMDIDIILKCGISLASLVYLILKIRELIRRGKR
tara:strand:- start:604 stop:765 length:162 start_codon:yes stop_codon:yes gene_type:complete